MTFARWADRGSGRPFRCAGGVLRAAQLFFGAWLFPLGYLVYKSRFLPKFLGVLLMLDGIAITFWFFQALLLPDYPALSYPGMALSFIAEVGLGLWLLIKGVKVTGSATSGI